MGGADADEDDLMDELDQLEDELVAVCQSSEGGLLRLTHTHIHSNTISLSLLEY